MVRFVISSLLKLLGNAIGLIVAAVVLEDMELSGGAFVIAAAIFTVASIILQPLIVKIAMQHANVLMGSTALVTTFVGLVVTNLLSDGLVISGAVTWLLATIIVWVAALIAGVVLPALFLKQAVTSDRR
jgi:putative membrane protein